MSKGRATYLQKVLKSGKYYKPGKGYVTLDEETKNKYSQEIKVLASGGYLSQSNDYNNYVDQTGELTDDAINNLKTQQNTLNGTGYGISQNSAVGSTALKGASVGANIGSSILPGWGTVIGGAVGAIGGGLVGNKKYKKGLEDYEETQDINSKTIDKQVEDLRIKQDIRKTEAYNDLTHVYNTEGTGNVNFFGAKGGVIPKYNQGGNMNIVSGGVMQPLSSDTQKVVGNTHEEGGVKISNKSGKPIAEVEDEEVIKDGNLVYSERSGYADKAEKLSKKKAKYEAKLKSTNKFERVTAKRNIEKIDFELDEIFKLQELEKAQKEAQKEPQQGLGQKMAYGGPIDELNADLDYSLNGENIGYATKRSGNIALSPATTILDKNTNLPLEYQPNNVNVKSNNAQPNWGNVVNIGSSLLGTAANIALPLIDNVYNNEIIKKTPQIPIPELQKAKALKTNININPQLNEVDSGIKAYNTGVTRSSIDPQNRRANQLMANIKGIREKNNLRGQKENTETSLINQSRLNEQGIDTSNLAKIDKYNYDKMGRETGILSAQSQNVAQSVQDVQTSVRELNQMKLDDRKIMYDSMKYGDSGVTGYMLNDKEFTTGLKLDKNKQTSYKNLIKSSGRKDYIKQWNDLFPNNKIND